MKLPEDFVTELQSVLGEDTEKYINIYKKTQNASLQAQ